jgi:hypothetical protein
MPIPVYRNAEPNAETLAELCLYIRRNDLLRGGREPENAPDGAAGWRDHLRHAFPNATTLPKGKGAAKARQALIRDADAAACKALGITRYQHLTDAEREAKAAAKAAAKDAAPAPDADEVPADVLAGWEAMSDAERKRVPAAFRRMMEAAVK